jgi:flagellar biogenesis protein FliO
MSNRLRMAVGAMVLATCLGAGSLRAQEAESRPFMTPTTSRPSSFDGQWGRVLLSLAVVAGLIVLARVVLKRVNPSAMMAGRCGAMEVLARSTLSMKHQLVLVRLGRRVLLLGAAPQGLCTLCELTDPAEIAQVLDTLHKGGGDEFLKQVQAKSQQFEQASADAPSPEAGPVRRLSDKIRNEFREDQP